MIKRYLRCRNYGDLDRGGGKENMLMLKLWNIIDID